MVSWRHHVFMLLWWLWIIIMINLPDRSVTLSDRKKNPSRRSVVIRGDKNKELARYRFCATLAVWPFNSSLWVAHREYSVPPHHAAGSNGRSYGTAGELCFGISGARGDFIGVHVSNTAQRGWQCAIIVAM